MPAATPCESAVSTQQRSGVKSGRKIQSSTDERNQYRMESSAGPSSAPQTDQVEKELLFLITQFLAGGRCQKAAEVLQRELEELNLLPARTDINGRIHPRTYEEFAKLHHLPPDFLLKLCSGVGPVLDGLKPPSVSGLQVSLLGQGKQSLIRHTKGQGFWNPHSYGALRNGVSMVPPNDVCRSFPINKLLAGREISGVANRRLVLSESFVAGRMHLACRIFGHLSSVFCVTFDRTGQYIFTGADDNLIKVWSAQEGRLLFTFRGCFGEVSDFSVNQENTLLAAGSCDKLIRVWNLKTGAQMAVLAGHTAFISSIHFLPYVNADRSTDRFLVSTSNDGSICFWRWNVETKQFDSHAARFIERQKSDKNQIMCVSYSPGGSFLAAGCSDSFIRIYRINEAGDPEKTEELEGHSSQVDSISWSNRGLKFLSGSRDGTARIWTFQRQKWTSQLLSIVSFKKATETNKPADTQTSAKIPKIKVTMVAWSADDAFVVAMATDFVLRVFDGRDGHLVHNLFGHTDESFVLEPNPANPRMILSAAHDGMLCLWDIVTGKQLKKHHNFIEGFGHGAIFDAKISPDGCTIAAVDSHGQLSIFSTSSNDKIKNVPKEQFFHTDYRPLVRDHRNYVVDEQTQMAPNRMPPPFLVSSDGSPYPAAMQRLVPGRERCTDAYLEPQLVLNQNFVMDVVEPSSTDDDSSQDVVGGHPEPSSGPYPTGCWRTRSLVAQMDRATISHSWAVREELGLIERELYDAEMARSPVVVAPVEDSPRAHQGRRRKRSIVTHGYGTRTSRQPTTFYNTEEFVAAAQLPSSDSSDSDYTSASAAASSVSGSDSESDAQQVDSDNSDWEEENSRSTRARPAAESAVEPVAAGSRRVRRRLRNQSSDDDEQSAAPANPVDFSNIGDIVDSEQTAEATTSKDAVKTQTAKKSRPIRKAKQTALRDPLRSPEEVPESQRFPEWLTTIFPRKSPFFPQIQDEVVYFWQGHQMYVRAVRDSGLYEIDEKSLPYLKHSLKTELFCKVVALKYILFPYRLCHIKLQPFNVISGENVGVPFIVRYHDMANVVDFIVLKAHYDSAISNNWQSGDPFRAVIDDKWYFGAVEEVEPMDPAFPLSKFQSLKVRWDNNDVEPMSSWDLEPIGDIKPPAKGSSIDVSQDDFRMLSLSYEPRPSDWSDNTREEETIRIIEGINCLSEFSYAESFNAPVDLDTYPDYQMIVEYPIDLSTIRSRLENQFYRRVSAVLFDVEYIHHNAKQFNQRGSEIVRRAQLITDVLKRYISDPSCSEIRPVYIELNAKCGDQAVVDGDSDEVSLESTPHGFGKSKDERLRRKSSKRRSSHSSPGYNTRRRTEKSWADSCREIIDVLLASKDAEPFKRASMSHQGSSADEAKLDLEFIAEKLHVNGYRDAREFNNDVLEMFKSTQSTSHRSERKKDFAMTLRLKAHYDQLIKPLLIEKQKPSRTRNLEHIYNTRQSHPATTSSAATVRPRLAGDLDVATSQPSKSVRVKKILSIKAKPNRIASDSSENNLVPSSQRSARRNIRSQLVESPLLHGSTPSPPASNKRPSRIRRSAASQPVSYKYDSSSDEEEDFMPVVPETKSRQASEAGDDDDNNFNVTTDEEESDDEAEKEETKGKSTRVQRGAAAKANKKSNGKRRLETSDEEEPDDNLSDDDEDEHSDESDTKVGSRKRKSLAKPTASGSGKNKSSSSRSAPKSAKASGQMETRFRGQKIPARYCELSSGEEEMENDDGWGGISRSQPTCSSRGRIIKRKKYS